MDQMKFIQTFKQLPQILPKFIPQSTLYMAKEYHFAVALTKIMSKGRDTVTLSFLSKLMTSDTDAKGRACEWAPSYKLEYKLHKWDHERKPYYRQVEFVTKQTVKWGLNKQYVGIGRGGHLRKLEAPLPKVSLPNELSFIPDITKEHLIQRDWISIPTQNSTTSS